MKKEKCVAIVDNIVEEVKLTFPMIKINRWIVMDYIGYDKWYLYKYKEERLSGQVYDKLYSVLQSINIDIMIGDILQDINISIIENKKTVSEDALDPILNNELS